MAVRFAISEVLRLYGTGLHQTHLLEKFNEKNLAKISFFKVTNKGKPPRMFSLACSLTKNDVEFFAHRNFVEKSISKRGFFDHQNYIVKSKWKQRRFFDNRNYIEKSTWKKRGFLDQRYYTEKSTWKKGGVFDN